MNGDYLNSEQSVITLVTRNPVGFLFWIFLTSWSLSAWKNIQMDFCMGQHYVYISDIFLIYNAWQNKLPKRTHTA